jgi:hypothetical protein
MRDAAVVIYSPRLLIARVTMKDGVCTQAVCSSRIICIFGLLRQTSAVVFSVIEESGWR